MINTEDYKDILVEIGVGEDDAEELTDFFAEVQRIDCWGCADPDCNVRELLERFKESMNVAHKTSKRISKPMAVVGMYSERVRAIYEKLYDAECASIRRYTPTYNVIYPPPLTDRHEGARQFEEIKPERMIELICISRDVEEPISLDIYITVNKTAFEIDLVTTTLARYFIATGHKDERYAERVRRKYPRDRRVIRRAKKIYLAPVGVREICPVTVNTNCFDFERLTVPKVKMKK